MTVFLWKLHFFPGFLLEIFHFQTRSGNTGTKKKRVSLEKQMNNLEIGVRFHETSCIKKRYEYQCQCVNDSRTVCCLLSISRYLTHSTGINNRPNTTVSYDSFQRLSKQIFRETKRERRLKRVFQEFDVEKKGYIEAQGIKRVLRRLNIDHTESDIDLMIKMADTKGDERVDFDEFIQIFGESDFIQKFGYNEASSLVET